MKFLCEIKNNNPKEVTTYFTQKKTATSFSIKYFINGLISSPPFAMIFHVNKASAIHKINVNKKIKAKQLGVDSSICDLT